MHLSKLTVRVFFYNIQTRLDGNADRLDFRIMIHKEKSNKMQECIKSFIIPYFYEAQRVLGDTPPIIRSLQLHWQFLVFHTWKVDGHVVGGQHQRLPVHF